MEYRLDKPITDVKDDLLKRASFSENVADAILKLSATGECAVVGIQGEWGSGKTSVSRMVEYYLKDKVTVVRLETWLATDKESLFKEFFTCILEAANSDKELEACYEAILEYANRFGKRALRSLSFEVGLFSTKAQVDMSKIITEESPKTLESSKQDINTKLADRDVKPIVFFVDDIDRLSYEEIAVLFQLVKNIADFKKIIYVLCYDKNIVGNALDNVHSGKGYEYIEKVVQIPIDIPLPNKTLISKYFIGLIEMFLKEKKEESRQIDESHWHNLYNFGICADINNLRDCNRLFNAFIFKFNQFGQECDFADLLCITYLELEMPNILSLLMSNKTVLLEYDGYFSQDVPAEAAKNLWNKIESSYAGRNINSLKHIIGNMFPKFAKKADLGIVYMLSDEGQTTNKISNYLYFDRFFTLTLNEDEVSNLELIAWLDSKTKIDFEFWLNKWRKENKLGNALEEANKLIKSSNTSGYRVCSLVGFIELLHVLSNQCFSRFSSKIFGLNEESLRDYLIRNIFRNLLGEISKEDLLTSIFKDNDISISIKSSILIECSSGYDWCYGSKHLKESPKLLDEDQFKMAESLFINCIDEHKDDDTFFDEDSIEMIMYIWKNIDQIAFDQYIISHQGDKDIIKLVSVYVHIGMVHSSVEPSYLQWYFETSSWPKSLDIGITFDIVNKVLVNQFVENDDLERKIKLCAFLKFYELIKKYETEGKTNLNLQIRWEDFSDICEKYGITKESIEKDEDE